jgi:hypothetical protein
VNVRCCVAGKLSAAYILNSLRWDAASSPSRGLGRPLVRRTLLPTLAVARSTPVPVGARPDMSPGGPLKVSIDLVRSLQGRKP